MTKLDVLTPHTVVDTSVRVHRAENVGGNALENFVMFLGER
ncbi:MAG: hypothetical protein ACFFAE_07410 [Candidatus Hodarchaeota archaeon]